jgi:PKHD-type hydroxylase
VLAARAHPLFFSAALPKRVLPPMFNRYGAQRQPLRRPCRPGGALPPAAGERVRTDLSCTLFLCDPDDYDGGELVIDDPFGPRA